MRTPSRNMLPPRSPARATQAIAWLFLGAVAASVLWFASTWVVATAACIAAAGWIHTRAMLERRRARLAALVQQREGESICGFARSFDTRAVDPWVMRAAYETLQKELRSAHPAFPVRASDALDALLFDADDLDMVVAPEIARRANRSLAATQANPYFDKVRTVADLVMFFNAQPKANPR